MVLCRLNALTPRMVPQRLEFNQCASNAVVCADDFLALLRCHDVAIRLELLKLEWVLLEDLADIDRIEHRILLLQPVPIVPEIPPLGRALTKNGLSQRWLRMTSSSITRV